MMKTLLVILFAITSSSALAQRHVPGGGPVGSPGNPGTYNPPRGNPYPGPSYPGPGTHVPGGGPQGPRGPVIVIQPSYPQPSYPNPYPYPSYPTPSYPSPSYPTPSYPTPSYPDTYLGPCTINQSYSGSSVYFTVYDGRGNYVYSSYDFGQAMRTAQNYDQMGYCRGIRNNTSVGGGGYPNPYPTPYPQTYCNVMPGSDAYGRQFYRVQDRAGRIIYTSADYNQALNVSRTDARCFQY